MPNSAKSGQAICVADDQNGDIFVGPIHQSQRNGVEIVHRATARMERLVDYGSGNMDHAAVLADVAKE